MTQDPNLPFQPPGGSQPGPPPKKSSTGYSLLSLLFGLAWGLIGPPVIGGIIGGALSAIGVSDGITIIISIIAAATIVIAVFLLVIKQSDPAIPEQAAIRTAMKVSAITSVAAWGVGLLLLGLCFALLASAYQ